jgi:hypothetical protein
MVADQDDPGAASQIRCERRAIASGGLLDRTARVTRRRLGLATLALAVGVAIGLADSSPGWDSTGLTAGALFLSAAVFAGVARDRPWLWALMIGLPTPILDVVRTGNAGSVLALGFAAAGAAIGWTVRRAG